MQDFLKKFVPSIEGIADELDLEFVDLAWETENKTKYLRVYLDKKGGISLEDCVAASEKISEILDNSDDSKLEEQYYLDVSSPGIERPLVDESDYEKHIDEYVHVSFYQKVDKEKFFEGYLVDVTDEGITLKVNKKGLIKKYNIDWQNIAKGRLAIKF